MTLYPVALLFTYDSSSFFVYFLGFSTYTIISSLNKDSFTFFQVFMPFFFVLPALTTFTAVLKQCSVLRGDLHCLSRC